MSDRRDRLERFFGIDGTNPVLALDLAALCVEETDLRRASEVLDSVRPHIGDAKLLNAFGLLYGRIGAWESAVGVLTEAARLDPASAEVRFNLGYAQLRDEQFDSSRASFAEAVALRPEDSAFRFYLGLAAYEAVRYDEARDAFEQVLRLNPEHEEASSLLGTLALESGDMALVQKQAERLLKSGDAARFEGMWLKAQAATLDFDFDTAVEWLRKAEQLNSGDTDVQLLLGQLLLGKRQIPEARAALTRAAESGSAPAWVGLGWCALMENDLTSAETAFNRAVQADPDLADGHAGLALVASSASRQAESETHLRRALALNPDHPLVMALKAGQEQPGSAAAERLKTLLEAFPVSPIRKINIPKRLSESKFWQSLGIKPGPR